MKARTLIAFAATAALALPLAAQSQADQAKSDGGAAAMFRSLDKNRDGFLSRDETKGSPYEKDFTMLDKDNDGRLSPEEHAAAPQHSGGKAATGGTTGGSSKKY
ncbi:MAG TPA: EF-hand domain-containing protein [Burkholderiales bacterium]|nr:EF-hand domain-containing protein [Burkholderiales bacterium]